MRRSMDVMGDSARNSSAGRGRFLLALGGVLAAVAAFLLLEGAFRLLGWPRVWPSDLITEYDSTPLLTRTRRNLSIRTYPRNVQVTTNSAGFRGREVSLEKPPGVVRIFALGDSTTFGYDVADDETYSAVLEGLLNSGSPVKRYEVVNAGVIGYTTVQGIRQLKDVVLPYHPDIVIVSFGLNDATWLWKYIYYGGRELEDKKPAPAWRVNLRNVLFNGSAVLRWGIWSLENWREARFRGQAPVYREEESAVPWKEYLENLRRMDRLARAGGSSVVFLPAPVQLKFPPVDLKGLSREDLLERLRVGRDLLARAQSAAERREALRLIAAVQEQLGRKGDGLKSLREALQQEDRRDDQRMNALRYAGLMMDAARSLAAPVVDAPALFSAREVADNPGGLFADPYHAGPLGHRIIAEQLAKVIEKKTGK